MANSEITEFSFFPTGWPESSVSDKFHFVLKVSHRKPGHGDGHWAVMHGDNHFWDTMTEEFEPYGKERFSLAKATAIAYDVVDDVKISGWTFEQWDEHFKKLTESEQSQSNK